MGPQVRLCMTDDITGEPFFTFRDAEGEPLPLPVQVLSSIQLLGLTCRDVPPATPGARLQTERARRRRRSS